jgi:hypothetical protein
MDAISAAAQTAVVENDDKDADDKDAKQKKNL